MLQHHSYSDAQVQAAPSQQQEWGPLRLVTTETADLGLLKQALISHSPQFLAFMKHPLRWWSHSDFKVWVPGWYFVLLPAYHFWNHLTLLNASWVILGRYTLNLSFLFYKIRNTDCHISKFKAQIIFLVLEHFSNWDATYNWCRHEKG